MAESSNTFEVIIAGAGPAGASTAIHLARRGTKVLLVEQKKFPREKLCGEFISPECRDHFRKLGVETEMDSSTPARLTETVFYSSKGHRISVPTEWLTASAPALGLSRAEMDHKLLQQARRLGVTVLEEASVTDVLESRNCVSGVRVKTAEKIVDYHSPVTIDATGRTRAVLRKLSTPDGRKARVARARLIAFKVHLRNARVADEACEIYSYRGGYGGLSNIERGLSNLCFIAAASDVRRCNSDPATVVDRIVTKNPRAAYALAGAEVHGEWLSVALEGFGRQTLVPRPGLLTIGDAAAFIDPFTGSGMLMAFESGELAAATIHKHLKSLSSGSYAALGQEYRHAYARKFDSRLRISGLLRRTAYFPLAAEAAILFFSLNDRLRRKLARATRSSEAALLSQR
ncbi:MAG TPA: NAD(P)/FAD-dependent oxidoreductase [Pyrinomonadaceae bacterium]|nr:NAD(P)/FAD-dependent oxidoreductase [Pyrinomonadaceae bacterium]